MTSDDKLYSIIAICITIIICVGICFSLYIESFPKTNIIKINPTPDIVILAMKYHGITEVSLDKDGKFLYFIRDSKWCRLFNNGFRNWYADKYGDSNGN